ncbi:hypothetical protein DMH88_14965 [Escherichia coli]|nr:hypothetical protein [Escherichia coli]
MRSRLNRAVQAVQRQAPQANCRSAESVYPAGFEPLDGGKAELCGGAGRCQRTRSLRDGI